VAASGWCCPSVLFLLGSAEARSQGTRTVSRRFGAEGMTESRENDDMMGVGRVGR
jgi:hypothetical protein